MKSYRLCEYLGVEKMWDEIATILRYSSLNLARSSGRRRLLTIKRYSLLGFFVRNLSTAIIFGVMMTVFFISMVKHQSSNIFNYTIEGTGISLGELIVSPWLLMGTIIFLVSATPAMVYNIIDSSDMEFLLTLPIHRSSIVMVKNLEILPYYSMGFAMIFPAYIILGYFSTGWMGGLVGFLASIIYIGFLWALSTFLASILNMFMGRVVARKVAIMTYMVSMMLFIFSYNTFIPKLSKSGSIDSLLRYAHFMTSPLLPYTWFSRAILGDHLWWLGALVPMILIYGAIHFNSQLEFSKSRFHMKRKESSFQSRPFSRFKKDLLLLKRAPQLLYMLVYPVVFSMIFLFQKEATTAIIIYVQITAFYSSLTTALLLRQEFLVWPTPLIFPMNFRDLVMPKIIIPTSIYFSIYTFLTAVLLLIKLMEPWMSMFIPIVLLIILSSTFLGARIFLKHPIRPVKGKKIFTILEVLIIQGVTLLWVFSTIGAIQIGVTQKWAFSWILKYVSPSVSIASMVVFVRKIISEKSFLENFN
jgi:ABC-2 type transport system permease protein